MARYQGIFEAAGITPEQVTALARAARAEASRRMTVNSTYLGTPTADAIGARFWLENVTQRYAGLRILRENAALYVDDAAGFEYAEQMVEDSDDPVARARNLVNQRRGRPEAEDLCAD